MSDLKYNDYMDLPWSRRQRLVERKMEIERKRGEAQRQAQQRGRARRAR